MAFSLTRFGSGASPTFRHCSPVCRPGCCRGAQRLVRVIQEFAGKGDDAGIAGRYYFLAELGISKEPEGNADLMADFGGKRGVEPLFYILI